MAEQLADAELPGDPVATPGEIGERPSIMTVDIPGRDIAAGQRGAACVEEIRRVIWACDSSILQASSWRGAVLGNTWASVSQTSKKARLKDPCVSINLD